MQFQCLLSEWLNLMLGYKKNKPFSYLKEKTPPHLNYGNSNRLEKALLQPVTRTSTGKLPPTRANAETPTQNRTNVVVKSVSAASPLANSKQVSIGQKASAEEIKEKMEQELRMQRAEHHKKRTLEMMQQKKGKQHF